MINLLGAVKKSVDIFETQWIQHYNLVASWVNDKLGAIHKLVDT